MRRPRAVQTIVAELKPRCRRCGGKLKLNELLESLWADMAARLDAGERVGLPGIGILRVTRVKDREMCLVETGERREVEGWRVVRFRAARDLKERINAGRRGD